MTDLLREDTEEIVSDGAIPWPRLKNRTVLVTGATGLIGSAIVRALAAANQKYALGIQTAALGRNEAKGRLLEKYGAAFIKHDIRAPFIFPNNVDYVFHCAAVTSSAEMVKNPAGVIDTSLKGLYNIITAAKEKQAESMVYLSSMEVYGNTAPELELVAEDDLGYIDIKNPRSCYPESKRMCECICNSWFAQYGTPVKIARPARTFGAGSPFDADEHRVFAQFARSAAAGKNIVLHTEGNSQGDYCYISDAVRALFLLLLNGENGQAYNIVNPQASATIREMAELVARDVCEKNISVIVDAPKDIKNRGYLPDITRRLSAEKIKSLGWIPKYGLVDMYKRMIESREANQ